MGWFLMVVLIGIFCCFVDYTKAFDTIDRLNLWYKLSKIGICGKLLSVIKYILSIKYVFII
jgi:hypothetical protein